MSTDDLFSLKAPSKKNVCSKLLTKVIIASHSDIKLKLLKPPYEEK